MAERGAPDISNHGSSQEGNSNARPNKSPEKKTTLKKRRRSGKTKGQGTSHSDSPEGRSILLRQQVKGGSENNVKECGSSTSEKIIEIEKEADELGSPPTSWNIKRDNIAYEYSPAGSSERSEQIKREFHDYDAGYEEDTPVYLVPASLPILRSVRDEATATDSPLSPDEQQAVTDGNDELVKNKDNVEINMKHRNLVQTNVKIPRKGKKKLVSKIQECPAEEQSEQHPIEENSTHKQRGPSKVQNSKDKEIKIVIDENCQAETLQERKHRHEINVLRHPLARRPKSPPEWNVRDTDRNDAQEQPDSIENISERKFTLRVSNHVDEAMSVQGNSEQIYSEKILEVKGYLADLGDGIKSAIGVLEGGRSFTQEDHKQRAPKLKEEETALSILLNKNLTQTELKEKLFVQNFMTSDNYPLPSILSDTSDGEVSMESGTDLDREVEVALEELEALRDSEGSTHPVRSVMENNSVTCFVDFVQNLDSQCETDDSEDFIDPLSKEQTEELINLAYRLSNEMLPLDLLPLRISYQHLDNLCEAFVNSERVVFIDVGEETAPFTLLKIFQIFETMHENEVLRSLEKYRNLEDTLEFGVRAIECSIEREQAFAQAYRELGEIVSLSRVRFNAYLQRCVQIAQDITCDCTSVAVAVARLRRQTSPEGRLVISDRIKARAQNIVSSIDLLGDYNISALVRNFKKFAVSNQELNPDTIADFMVTAGKMYDDIIKDFNIDRNIKICQMMIDELKAVILLQGGVMREDSERSKKQISTHEENISLLLDDLHRFSNELHPIYEACVRFVRYYRIYDPTAKLEKKIQGNLLNYIRKEVIDRQVLVRELFKDFQSVLHEVQIYPTMWNILQRQRYVIIDDFILREKISVIEKLWKNRYLIVHVKEEIDSVMKRLEDSLELEKESKLILIGSNLPDSCKLSSRRVADSFEFTHLDDPSKALILNCTITIGNASAPLGAIIPKVKNIPPRIVRDLLTMGKITSSNVLSWLADLFGEKLLLGEDSLRFLDESMESISTHILCGGRSLHLAVLNGDMNKVGLLLNKGESVHDLDSGGRSSLHLAALRAQQGGPVTRLLLSFSPNKLQEDLVLGWTPAQYIDSKCQMEEQSRWNLLGMMSGRSKAELQDMNCLEASFAGLQTTLQLALTRGFNVNQKDKYENTAGHLAIAKGSLKCLEVLVKNGLDLTLKDKVGRSLLFTAVQTGQLDIVKFLLENGDYKLEISQNVTAFGVSPVHIAAQNGSVDIWKLLQEKKEGVTVDERAADNSTPLHLAALGGHMEMVKLLVVAGANVNAQNSSLDTPLHLACRCGSVPVIRILLTSKANPTLKNRRECTPRDAARENFHYTVVSFLFNA